MALIQGYIALNGNLLFGIYIATIITNLFYLYIIGAENVFVIWHVYFRQFLSQRHLIYSYIINGNITGIVSSRHTSSAYTYINQSIEHRLTISPSYLTSCL